MALKQNQIQVTTINPQSNAIIERVHKVVNDMLNDMIRSFDLEIIMKIYNNKKMIHLITSFNQLHGYHAIRSIYHTILQATPCQLVFGMDMMHNIAFRENWDQIQKRKYNIL
jgi:hypothetical protein